MIKEVFFLKKTKMLRNPLSA